MDKFEEICCLCLRKNLVLVEIKSKSEGNLTYLEKLDSSLVQLATVIKEIDVPPLICQKCCDTVELVFKFNETCLNNINTLFLFNKTVDTKNEMNLNKRKTNIFEKMDVNFPSNVIQEGKMKKEQIKTKIENCFTIENELIENDLQNLDTGQDHNIKLQIPKNVPSGEEHRCSECSKMFKNKSNLNQHMQIHDGIKLFTCHICGKSFNRKDNLNNHILIHSQNKTHICYICGKAFKQKSSLNTHKLTHTNDKRFSCELCDKKFHLKTLFDRHKLVHSGEKPFGCEFCDKKFNDKSYLVKHKRIHSGEKPFSCQDCNKAFNRKSHLIDHRRIHSGDKPFQCNFCNKSCNTRSNLKKHELKMHSNDQIKL